MYFCFDEKLHFNRFDERIKYLKSEIENESQRKEDILNTIDKIKDKTNVNDSQFGMNLSYDQ